MQINIINKRRLEKKQRESEEKGEMVPLTERIKSWTKSGAAGNV